MTQDGDRLLGIRETVPADDVRHILLVVRGPGGPEQLSCESVLFALGLEVGEIAEQVHLQTVALREDGSHGELDRMRGLRDGDLRGEGCRPTDIHEPAARDVIRRAHVLHVFSPARLVRGMGVNDAGRGHEHVESGHVDRVLAVALDVDLAHLHLELAREHIEGAKVGHELHGGAGDGLLNHGVVGPGIRGDIGIFDLDVGVVRVQIFRTLPHLGGAAILASHVRVRIRGGEEEAAGDGSKDDEHDEGTHGVSTSNGRAGPVLSWQIGCLCPSVVTTEGAVMKTEWHPRRCPKTKDAGRRTDKLTPPLPFDDGDRSGDRVEEYRPDQHDLPPSDRDEAEDDRGKK